MYLYYLVWETHAHTNNTPSLTKQITHNTISWSPATRFNYSKSRSDHVNLSNDRSAHTHIFLCVHLMRSFGHSGSGRQLEPGAKGPEVNELWQRALVSNESWQRRLSRVTHNPSTLAWLWMRKGNTTQRRAAIALWPKCTSKHHVTFVLASQTTQEKVRLSQKSMWALFDFLWVTQSLNDSVREVKSMVQQCRNC